MAIIDVQLPNSLAKALRLPQKSPIRQQLKVGNDIAHEAYQPGETVIIQAGHC